MVYGYCRISTKKQSIERQVNNIRNNYPYCKIIKEVYSGTKINRPQFNTLLMIVKEGDTIVFDEISRMSRNAEEGYATYQALYDRGVNLVFIKEPMLNTEVYKSVEQIAQTGNWIADAYIGVTNTVLMELAKRQIRSAFEIAEHEVEFLKKRTKEALEIARQNGKQIGLKKGTTLVTKKSTEMKRRIKFYSKDFGGGYPDVDIIKILGISRNTYYKYKRELKNEIFTESVSALIGSMN